MHETENHSSKGAILSADGAERVLSGALTDDVELVQPLTVQIEYDDGEYIGSEPRFLIHASALSEDAAITAFRQIFAGYAAALAKDESALSPHLHRQLDYVRSMIRKRG